MSVSPDRMVAGLVGDRYEITGLIAHGGMGTVYRARDTVLDRTVALKVLKAGGSGPEFVARFRTEATNAARLSHPNIVAVYDFGYEDDTPYMAMEYVDGQNLREILTQQGPLPIDVAAQVASQVASALEHARRAGIVHRDVKPENILITTDGRVKVADFGLSRALAESRATQAGMLFGTAAYLAPEQVQGSGADHRADVYSLGIVLYEALTGTTPFTGDSPVVIAYKRVTDDVPSARAMRADVPSSLDAVLLRATMRDPDERYPTAGAMSEALRNSVARADTGQIGILVHHTQAIPIANEPTVAIGAPGARGTKQRARKRRKIVALLVALGIAAGAIFGGTFFATAKVPDVHDFLQNDAKLAVQRAGFRADVELRNDALIAAGHVVAQDPRAGIGRRRGTTVRLVVSLGPELISVPAVAAGTTYERATELLSARGFLIRREDVFDASVGKGEVVSTAPASGVLVEKGETVTVKVSKGPQMERVPDVAGNSLADARAELRSAGFAVAVSHERSDTVAKGSVIRQTPKPGRDAARGSTVSLVVSDGPPLVTVPDLRCMTQRQASDALAHVGLRAGFSGRGPRVVDQAQTPKSQQPKGSTITAYLGYGSYC
jgi:serine/threonine-protein kinase